MTPFRLMGIRLLREDPSRRKPPFVQIHFVIDTRNIFKYYYPNVPRGCSAVPMTPFSPHGHPSAPRRPLPTKTTLCPNSLYYTYTQHFQILLSKCTPGIFCGSIDTIFASWAPVCSEKTPPDENHHLSKFILSYTHATFSNINIQMYPGDALRFQ